MTSELRTCPWCGSAAEITAEYGGDIDDEIEEIEPIYFVGCSNDDCPVFFNHPYDEEDDAIIAWNTRRPISAEGVREASRELAENNPYFQAAYSPAEADSMVRAVLRASGIEVEGDA